MPFDLKITSPTQPGVSDVVGGTITVLDNADGTWQLTSPDAITEFRMNTNKGDITKAEMITESLTTLNRAFYQCAKLKTFVASSGMFSQVTDMLFCFSGCYKLETVSLFDTSNVSSFSRTWSNCKKLKNIPNFNTSSGTNFYSAWSNCILLTSFPLLDTSEGTNFKSAWYNCKNLPSFPALDTSKGTRFYATWRKCQKLTSLPLLDTSKGTDFGKCFDSCTSLKCMQRVDTTSATSVAGIFLNTGALCRPNSTEQAQIAQTPGINWVSDRAYGDDCCIAVVSGGSKVGASDVLKCYIGEVEISKGILQGVDCLVS